MSEAADPNKIAGFIPKSKYVLITYYLILTSMAIGLLNVLMIMNASFSPLTVIGSLAGLAALLMGLAGLFLFKEEFNSLEKNHLAYICIMFGVCFVANAVVGAIFLPAGMGSLLVANLLLYAVEIILFYTGFNSFKKSRSITKDNLKDEVQLALKRG